MKETKFKWILYFISVVILGVIGIQCYWNFQNYLQEQTKVSKEIQHSLDEAIESYFINLTQKEVKQTEIKTTISSLGMSEEKIDLNSIFSQINQNLDFNPDTVIAIDLSVEDGKGFTSIQLENDDVGGFKELVSKVIFSLQNSQVEIGKVDSLFKKALQKKQIELDYEMIENHNSEKVKQNLTSYSQSFNSESSYLPHNYLILNYNTPKLNILKRISVSIILSFLLILGVLACLYYLIYIIQDQKKISQIKNDLIGNITHEFKTPIATISVALEEMREQFNPSEKQNKFFNVSENQLDKLNSMVEKLLETATLGKKSFNLKQETIEVNSLVEQLYERALINIKGKQISISLDSDIKSFLGDAVHFENAIDNIIDNAKKYGGNEIRIKTLHQGNEFSISVEDNGNTLTSKDIEVVFENFYRKSTGNKHDVKGYGIGLFYSKSIIESHGGSIELSLNPTTFKITLPYGK
ncbi:MAG: sensor histidine kinase [Flavobacteriales bacterium]